MSYTRDIIFTYEQFEVGEHFFFLIASGDMGYIPDILSNIWHKKDSDS